MKGIVFMILFIINVMIGHAQHYENVSIDELINTDEVIYCIDDSLLGIIIYCEPVFDSTMWHVTDYYGTVVVDIQDVDSIVLYNTGEAKSYYLDFSAYIPDYGWMSILQDKYISVWKTSTTNNPFEEPTIWKHRNETAILNGNPIAPWNPYTYLWSTGEITETIEITEPGIYSVTLTDLCGSATYSVEVRDNVELYRATVDLRTNKNKVTWLATPEQAEYITDVKIYRDGTLVGTAPYTSGYFLDAIGSDAAARTYQIVGVSKEGDDCPIPSYQKGTIHTTYYQDVNNDLNMTWSTPYVEEGAQGQLTGFEIYKYNPATEELTLIDAVNSSITDYTCSANAFVGGRAILAATFSSKGSSLKEGEELESRSFSNLSENILVVDEETLANFKVYPNPTNGAFTVQGIKDLTVFNTLGQTIATSHSENGTHQITVSSGIYFIKSDEGVVKKVVVE